MVGFVSMRLSRNFGVLEGVVIVLILAVVRMCFR
jgi:tetrahydromethanopterin S-methyltransferase subunit G